MRKTPGFAWAALILLTVVAARADRLVLSIGTALSEPGQKAIVAFNGRQEVLILATDLETKEKLRTVQILPFPSAPKVTAAPDATLSQLTKLVERHKVRFVSYMRGAQAPEIKVVSFQQIGSHAITVLETRDAATAPRAVQAYASKHGIKLKISPAEAANLSEYVKRGFFYLAVDVVELTPGVQSVQPVAYHFATPKLYYPLRTSNVLGHKGTVDLFIFLSSMAEHDSLERLFQPTSMGRIEAMPEGFESTLAVIPPDELPLQLRQLFGKRAARLGVYHYGGPLNFAADIWTIVKPARAKGKTPRPGSEEPPIHRLVRQQNADNVLRAIQTDPAVIHDAETQGESLMRAACKAGLAPVCKKLLAMGCDPNESSSLERLLHVAAESGSVKTCQVLLDGKADINGHGDYDDVTALEVAASAGKLEVVKFLLRRGAVIYTNNLLRVAKSGEAEILGLMMDECNVDQETLRRMLDLADQDAKGGPKSGRVRALLLKRGAKEKKP